MHENSIWLTLLNTSEILMKIKIDTAIPESHIRLSGIEASRGIAAMLVVLFHATGIINLPKYFSALPLNGFFSFGDAGVNFFFVLSGFIILFIHHKDIGTKSVFKNYIQKRFLRVYPIYWIVSLFVLLCLIFIPTLGNVPDISYIIQSLLLIPQNTMPLVIVAWTLTHEIVFYIIFGLIIYNRNLGLLITGLWFFGISVSFILNLKFNYFFNFIFNIHNLGFFFGMAVAITVRKFDNIQKPTLTATIGIFLFFFTGILKISEISLPTQLFTISYSISSSLIILGLVMTEKKQPIYIGNFLKLLGNSSYSIYLVHFLALSFFIKVLKKLSLEYEISINFIFLLLVISATATGIFFHIFIEKPLLKKLMKKNYSNDLPLKSVA